MGRVAAHVFIDDLSAGRPALCEDDVHHLSRVLRLRPGETVSVSDGRGAVQLCQWAGGPELEPIGAPVRHARPAPLLTVGFALTKGEHPEEAVQKLTEAGADRVVVVISARCVARWTPAQEGRRLQRLREVARQAAMQSRRPWLPMVEGPVPFPELAGAQGRGAQGEGPGSGGPAGGGTARLTAGGAAGLALAVPGGAPLTLSTPTVLVGPEGGWTDEELAAVPRHVGLGPYVLRAETAAVAAGVLLAALRAGLVTGTA
jgi:16S rRNA (uracil1498-N3)-methyltransferase